MNATKEYFNYLSDTLDETIHAEEDTVIEAATLVAQSLLKGGRFYVFGTGHSHIIAEEIYVRAGGLALVHAILPPEVLLHEMPTKSTVIERLEGYADGILNLYNLEERDTLLVISNSGRNNVPVEMCLGAKERGLNVIAMTSKQHGAQTSSRHKSGKMIGDIADITIDNHAPKGDAGFNVDGVETPVGPVSDFTGVALAQALVVTIVELLEKDNFEIPIFKSSNINGADAYNKELFDEYYGYWK